MVTEKIKPGYKQTEIGIIPEDWDVDFIKNHALITTGAKNTQDRIDGGRYPFFRIRFSHKKAGHPLSFLCNQETS